MHFYRGEVRVELPASHGTTALTLAEPDGPALLTLLANPGQPGEAVFPYPWRPAESLRLVVQTRGGASSEWPLRAPARLPPPVTATLQFPAGIALPPARHPFHVPAGAEGVLALALRNVDEAPQTLTVRLTFPQTLQLEGVAPGPDGNREVVRRITLRVRGEPALVRVPFRAIEGAAGSVRWRVEGPGLASPLAGERRVAVLNPARFRKQVRLDRSYFPADSQGEPLPHRPRERIDVEAGWLRALRSAWGLFSPEDVLRPVGHLGLTVSNSLPGEVVVVVRTRTESLAGGRAAAAFGHPLLVAEQGAVLSLLRVPPGVSLTLAQPVYLDREAVAPGRYRRCTTLHAWGVTGEPATRCETLRVAHTGAWGWVALWGLTGLCGGLCFWALVRLPRWLPRFPLRDAVFVALMVGLALVMVSLPGAFLRAASLFLAGPFAFLVDDIVFKFLLFLLLGAMFAVVRRPGVYFLFYALWMAFQALLQGQFTPVLVLFGAVTVAVLEAGLWVSGLTRSAAPPLHRRRLLAAALVVGACEGAIVYWHVHLIKVLYRQFFAEWYMLAQAASAASYAALGTFFGLRFGQRLRAMQGFAQGLGAAPSPAVSPAASPPGADAAPLALSGLTLTPEGGCEAILHQVSLRVLPGELVLLGGRSGAGKTTLLRVIQGLVPLPAGARLTLGGVDGRELSPAERARRTGLLFQEPALQVVRPTVRGEAAFGLDVLQGSAGLSPAARSTRVTRALRFFGLARLAERRTGAISGGELQRTALAALLAVRPPLVLLDEPLAHLDAAGRARLVRRLATLARAGAAVVVAEHRLDLLLPRAHRVVWLERGRVAWAGSAAAFRVSPPAMAAKRAFPVSRAVPGSWPGPPGSRDRDRWAAPSAALRDVVYAYPGGEAVLKGLRAELAPGRAVALTGANGAGKSTLLSLLVGLRRPQAGTVMLDGRSAAALSWARRAAAVGYLPQQAELLLQAPTVAEELVSALRWQNRSRAEIAAALGAWLPRLGLSEVADRYPHLLSRGERRRLALGAVAVAGPRVLLLDEPFAGQDGAQTAALLDLCAAFLRGHPSRSLIVSSHDLAPMEGFFHEVWHLADGALTARATDLAETGRPARLGVGA